MHICKKSIGIRFLVSLPIYLMNTSSTEASRTHSAPNEGNSLKKLQSQTLERVMDERQLSARKLAAMIEEDQFEVDMVAMQIADAREGESTLAKDVCEKIARVLNLSITVLYEESAIDTSLTQPADSQITATIVPSTTPSRQNNSDEPAPTTDLKKGELGPQRRTNVRKFIQEQDKSPKGELSDKEISSARNQRVRELLEERFGSLNPQKIQEFIDSIDFGKGRNKHSKKHFFKGTLLRAIENDPESKITISQAEIIAKAIGEELSRVAVAYTKWERERMDSPVNNKSGSESKPSTTSKETKQETGVTETEHVLGEIELTSRKMSELFSGKVKVVRSGRGYEVVARSKISHEELIDYLSQNLTREKLVELLLQKQSK